jgi:lipopolysaccharide export system protein LptA
MYYKLSQDTLTLRGLPRVMQGRSVVRADEIQVWPKARRVLCEPHAKAVLFPDQATWQAMREELSSHE